VVAASAADASGWWTTGAMVVAGGVAGCAAGAGAGAGAGGTISTGAVGLAAEGASCAISGVDEMAMTAASAVIAGRRGDFA
jgi:hypothetical protein